MPCFRVRGMLMLRERGQRSFPFTALWDTGATVSMVSQTIVDTCALQQKGVGKVNHVHGTTPNVPSYLIKHNSSQRCQGPRGTGFCSASLRTWVSMYLSAWTSSGRAISRFLTMAAEPSSLFAFRHRQTLTSCAKIGVPTCQVCELLLPRRSARNNRRKRK